MTESLPCAPGGPGVDILDFCFQADTVLEGIVIALVPIFGFFMNALTGKKWRALIRSWLYDATWSRAYGDLLDGLLARLERFFGPPHGWRAFELCFGLAVLYSIAYLLLQYVLRQAVPVLAILAVAMACAVGVVLVFLFRRVKKWHARARKVAARGRCLWLHLTEQGAYFVLGSYTCLAAIAVAIAIVTEGGIPTQLVRLTVVIVGTIASAIAGTIVGAFAFAATPIYIGRLIHTYAPANEFEVTVLVMVFSIPLLNGLFDWSSWWASRWLMARLREDALQVGVFRRLGAVLAHVVADLTIALACLFGLAIVIANVAFGVAFPRCGTCTGPRKRHRSQGMDPP